MFCLVVNDFGIKVTHMDDMHRLKTALEEHYTVAVDWKGLLFCGVKLSWDYINWHVTTHMTGYIGKALTKYQHPHPTVPQHAPYKTTTIQYGAKVQRVEEDKSPPLMPEQSNGSKTSSEHSSTMDEQSTPPSSLPSVQSWHDNPGCRGSMPPTPRLRRNAS